MAGGETFENSATSTVKDAFGVADKPTIVYIDAFV
jgi:hypothetical protein